VSDECVPSKEICNHIDDDCDGYTDEDDESQQITKEVCDDDNPCTAEYCAGEDGCHYELLSGNECATDACTTDGVCVEGVCTGTMKDCDDGNPCTIDECITQSGCLNSPMTGQECDNQDLCTENDSCVEGECSGKHVICNNGNPCTTDWCHPVDGCTYTPNSNECDDGNMCTANDQCAGGECGGEELSCDCQVDMDCGSFEDGNLCNGTLYCDTTELPFQCQVAQETIIQCPAPEGPNGPCLQPVCEPGSGECTVIAANDGAACDDANPCTAADECAAGVCAGLLATVCSDANLCTDDSCDPSSGCVFEPNSLPCADGDFCTQGDICQGGACVPGEALDCVDDNPCTTDGCNQDGSCSHQLLDGLPCSDGDGCTKDDVCVIGECIGIAHTDCCKFDAECDDENPCTENVCDLDSGQCQALTAPLDGTACDADGSGCTAGDECSGGVCTEGAQVECAAPESVCHFSVCLGTGSESYDCIDQPFAPGTPCDDGLACTVGSSCQADTTCGGGLDKGIIECTARSDSLLPAWQAPASNPTAVRPPTCPTVCPACCPTLLSPNARTVSVE